MAKAKSKTLKEKADKLFSEYIRRKNSIDGKTTCFTCGSVAPWKEQQCGHFISRVHLSTRWDEENVRVQCFPCNVWRRGNYSEFAKNLVRDEGPEILEKLSKKRAQTKKMGIGDYRELIESLKKKISNL